MTFIIKALLVAMATIFIGTSTQGHAKSKDKTEKSIVKEQKKEQKRLEKECRRACKEKCKDSCKPLPVTPDDAIEPVVTDEGSQAPSEVAK